MKLLIPRLIPVLLFVLFYNRIPAQNTYFIDGYHGGIYGHYPKNFTAFIVKNLEAHPDWNINLEIEPETWDSVQVREPEAYQQLQSYFEQQHPKNNRIEFVNPAYGQSYLFNISGESIIRQFEYGIKKIKQHFPAATFVTYSSEEPCFTSALPGILKSFGFKYASLKNPNTCWGGYTRAFGGEVLNWVGPDGAALSTVPRYASEGLANFSTWQTDAWTNSHQYYAAALKQGINNPVGMCLQDAGWSNGPWLNHRQGSTRYTTWNYYFDSIASRPSLNWKLSQEDIQVSLVWGSQKLQQIAQMVRHTENRLVQAEKLSAMAGLYGNYKRPGALLDEAWRNLLLAQHHDCWIVPLAWYGHVQRWIQKSSQLTDSVLLQAEAALINRTAANSITVINTSGISRKEVVRIAVPAARYSKNIVLKTEDGQSIIPQLQPGTTADAIELLFMASVPATSARTYRLEESPALLTDKQSPATPGYSVETDLYRLTLDSITGTIRSLVTKKDNKEWIDAKAGRKFNEIKGQFYEQQLFLSSCDAKNTITISENGPVHKKIKVTGKLGLHDFVQYISLFNGQPAIDFETIIYWAKNEGIGDSHAQQEGYDSKDVYKAFYVDTSKLSVSFPANIGRVRVFKDAPFDVTESRLSNTFFNRWDSIKNNIIYRWADLTDGKNGIALFSDHTTSYSYGNGFPLSLTIAYSGKGLWGGSYQLHDSTRVQYSIVPHAGNWQTGALNKEALYKAEPLMVVQGAQKNKINGILDVSGTGYEITSYNLHPNKLVVRFYNAQGKQDAAKIQLRVPVEKARWIQLNGADAGKAIIRNNTIIKTIPPFGVNTLELSIKKTGDRLTK
ncbi:hypothetical protein A8C56_20600 [Niabella ginsenosidivorans]|uniref:Glycosyl hydrolase n=1 Tax=Niabella ginsenosidivorans TaxID=1176587 RepID=A0A1A9I664_9BACT|nr:glycoside hydrolase family 38 C-terminal domain-containing protein [Niabella ginsenosidivorans]ANH83063.1 hypothetical protein A8C56_20600 [Niabella ginsenosidivorans]